MSRYRWPRSGSSSGKWQGGINEISPLGREILDRDDGGENGPRRATRSKRLTLIREQMNRSMPGLRAHHCTWSSRPHSGSIHTAHPPPPPPFLYPHTSNFPSLSPLYPSPYSSYLSPTSPLHTNPSITFSTSSSPQLYPNSRFLPIPPFFSFLLSFLLFLLHFVSLL
jgi:hypothetical protein